MHRKIKRAVLHQLLVYRGSLALAMVVLIALVSSCGPVVAQQAPERFRELDRNRDGRLSRDEVQGPAFDEMDTNRDESVSVEEAVTWARRTGYRQSSERPQAPEGASSPNRRPDTSGIGPAGNRNSASGPSSTASPGTQLQVMRNLDYVGSGSPAHRLDLVVPPRRDSASLPPLVVFIHGGGWESGNRDAGRRFLAPLLQTGRYAAASIEYRLSSEAIWPAQIHDCKAAIRWLRARGSQYGFDAQNIAVVGESAGGHLASMLGVTNRDHALEGTQGSDRSVSSDVQCVINFYGPSDLKRLGDSLGNAPSPISKLLGGSTQDKSSLAKEASPVSHVDPNDVPLMIIHGTRDGIVPIDQSEQLQETLSQAGVKNHFLRINGGQHGGFRNPEIDARAIAFLDRYLLGQSVSINESPLNP